MATTTVRAREIRAYVRAGASDWDLLEKYDLSTEQLHAIFKKLLAAEVITQVKLDERGMLRPEPNGEGLPESPRTEPVPGSPGSFSKGSVRGKNEMRMNSTVEDLMADHMAKQLCTVLFYILGSMGVNLDYSTPIQPNVYFSNQLLDMVTEIDRYRR